MNLCDSITKLSNDAGLSVLLRHTNTTEMLAIHMANAGIVNSWSLKSFARSHGKMKLANFVNKETGEAFKSCAFVDPDSNETVCLVGFSSNLGELTPSEIKNSADDLQVVQLESGTYKLCKRGGEAWEDIDLGL